MATVGAGDLRSYVSLQKPVYASDDAGAVTPSSWTTVCTAWAKIEPASDSRRAQALQAVGEMTHTVTIRYDPRVQSNWRVKFGTKYLYVVGPPKNVNQRYEFSELRCVETEVLDA